MKRAILGYIVGSRVGGTYCVSTYGPDHPILTHGGGADLFPSRRAAQRLIRRSIDYARARNLDWGKPEEYVISPVRHAR